MRSLRFRTLPAVERQERATHDQPGDCRETEDVTHAQTGRTGHDITSATRTRGPGGGRRSRGLGSRGLRRGRCRGCRSRLGARNTVVLGRVQLVAGLAGGHGNDTLAVHERLVGLAGGRHGRRGDALAVLQNLTLVADRRNRRLGGAGRRVEVVENHHGRHGLPVREDVTLVGVDQLGLRAGSRSQRDREIAGHVCHVAGEGERDAGVAARRGSVRHDIDDDHLRRRRRRRRSRARRGVERIRELLHERVGLVCEDEPVLGRDRVGHRRTGGDRGERRRDGHVGGITRSRNGLAGVAARRRGRREIDRDGLHARLHVEVVAERHLERVLAALEHEPVLGRDRVGHRVARGDRLGHVRRDGDVIDVPAHDRYVAGVVAGRLGGLNVDRDGLLLRLATGRRDHDRIGRNDLGFRRIHLEGVRAGGRVGAEGVAERLARPIVRGEIGAAFGTARLSDRQRGRAGVPLGGVRDGRRDFEPAAVHTADAAGDRGREGLGRRLGAVATELDGSLRIGRGSVAPLQVRSCLRIGGVTGDAGLLERVAGVADDRVRGAGDGRARRLDLADTERGRVALAARRHVAGLAAVGHGVRAAVFVTAGRRIERPSVCGSGSDDHDRQTEEHAEHGE